MTSPFEFREATSRRLNEMVDAARAREGENSEMEKASIWAAFFLGLMHPPENPLILLIWKKFMTDIMGDLIRAYYPDEAARRAFLKNNLTPAMDAIKSDWKDAAAGFSGK